MTFQEWPKLEPEDETGLVALDHHVTPERVISAYRHGIFPWPSSDPRRPIPWVCPAERAILEFESLRIPRSLRQSLRRRSVLRFTIDRAFDEVIRSCAAAPRIGQGGTWIIPPIIDAYRELHRRGHAHSVEAWDGETMVGGLYGVTSGGIFSGESMFHKVDDASKLCVLQLIAHLQSRGATWLDIQQLTPHFASLGARVISREQFLQRLALAQAAGSALFP